MAQGPGKYDACATDVREATSAAGVCVVVIGGTQGNGFSVQVIDSKIAKDLPRLLRWVADEIERSELSAN